MSEIIINLSKNMFEDHERLFIEKDGLTASIFQFSTGVSGLRLKNLSGELVLLPFQGQQIWSAEFNQRPLTMISMFNEPRPTREFLETFGGFFLHCGATGTGAPSSPKDKHVLHGELPNAPYQQAWVLIGEDQQGEYIGLAGRYHHTVAFSHNYIAEPVVKLYKGSSVFTIQMNIQNLKKSKMELMYLAHINFRPVDGGTIVYSAIPTPEHVRVRNSIPSHIDPGLGYPEFLEQLKRHPEIHHRFSSGQSYDPEVVFFIDYLADQKGFAHTMHILPDGSADYVRHIPAQLPLAVRWIVRTEDQQALGLIEPGTSEVEGYTAEKAKGNLKIIPPGGSWQMELQVGVLDATEVSSAAAHISQVIQHARDQLR